MNTAIDHGMITTAFELPGHRIEKNIGMARGIIVRSRSIVGTIGGGLQTLIGGDITLFTSQCIIVRSVRVRSSYETVHERARQFKGAAAL